MTTKEFIEKLEQEGGAAILKKMMAAGKNPEAVHAIAQEAGLTDSFDVFKAELTALSESMSQDLTDEQLASIAGGLSDDAVGGIAGTVVAGIIVGLMLI